MALPIIPGKKLETKPPSQPQKVPVASTAKGSPSVGAFSIKVAMKGNVKDVVSILRAVSFLEVAQEKDLVNALYVESRDINKQPYIFSILKAGEDHMEIVYSIPPGMSPSRRKLDMVRYLLNMLTMLEPYYDIDNKLVLQLMESSIKDVQDSVSMDYSKLYTEYDTVKKEVEDLKRKVKRLSDENTSLSSDNYEIKNKSDELLLRLKQLENVPEDALKAKLQEWILEHNGEINISEFCKVNNTNEVLVEEVLNKLMMEGYIEAVQ